MTAAWLNFARFTDKIEKFWYLETNWSPFWVSQLFAVAWNIFAMKIMGKQFVMGETIKDAVNAAQEKEKKRYVFPTTC